MTYHPSFLFGRGANMPQDCPSPNNLAAYLTGFGRVSEKSFDTLAIFDNITHAKAIIHTAFIDTGVPARSGRNLRGLRSWEPR